jgi:hypothetical protein
MFVNGKMRLVESIPRRGKRKKENDSEDEMSYVIL